MELSIHAPVSADDLSVEVRSAIAELGTIDQEIVRLVYWDGFTLAEVAQILNMRPPTVRSRHARARAKLRDALGADI